MVLSAFMVGLVELAEVWLIFRTARVLGGIDLDAALLLFGLSHSSSALAQVIFGHLDTLPVLIRMGQLDAYHLRPQPLLLQLITSDISLRRFARASVSIVALGVGLARNDIAWNSATAALLAFTLVGGIALFGGVFVCAAGLQFYLIDGSELTNSFTYGGSFAATRPASLFPAPMRPLFGFAIPVSFTAYLPTLALLGLPGPPLLPAWPAWLTPVAALRVWLPALRLWRSGTRGRHPLAKAAGDAHRRRPDDRPDRAGLRCRLYRRQQRGQVHHLRDAHLAAVSDRAEVRNLSIEEPEIEDVVRRIYESAR